MYVCMYIYTYIVYALYCFYCRKLGLSPTYTPRKALRSRREHDDGRYGEAFGCWSQLLRRCVYITTDHAGCLVHPQLCDTTCT